MTFNIIINLKVTFLKKVVNNLKVICLKNYNYKKKNIFKPSKEILKEHQADVL